MDRTGAKKRTTKLVIRGKIYHTKKDLDYLISPLYIVGELEVKISNYASLSQGKMTLDAV